MRKTPLPCFFFTSTTPPLLDFFFVPPLAYPALNFCVNYPDSQDRWDFVFPTSLRHNTPPPCSTSLRHPLPHRFILFYYTPGSSLLYQSPAFTPPPPDFVFFVSLRHKGVGEGGVKSGGGAQVGLSPPPPPLLERWSVLISPFPHFFKLKMKNFLGSLRSPT